jgi:hypothetical protein
MNKTWWGEYNSSFFLPTWNMSFARLLMRDFWLLSCKYFIDFEMYLKYFVTFPNVEHIISPNFKMYVSTMTTILHILYFFWIKVPIGEAQMFIIFLLFKLQWLQQHLSPYMQISKRSSSINKLNKLLMNGTTWASFSLNEMKFIHAQSSKPFKSRKVKRWRNFMGKKWTLKIKIAWVPNS